jgi:hypothetical protein
MSNDDEYAFVKKKGTAFHTNDDGMIQEIAFYAEVKKKTQYGQKGNHN